MNLILLTDLSPYVLKINNFETRQLISEQDDG
jgi:hypothetical protein